MAKALYELTAHELSPLLASRRVSSREVTGDASGLLRFELECDLREITLSRAED